jgi:hypothetical protein
MKKIILGFLIGVGVMFTTTIFASSEIEGVSAYLRQKLPISLDGKELKFEQPLLIYNGSTYVPLRELMQYTGKRVDWLGDRIDLKTMNIDIAQTLDGKYVMEGQEEVTHGRELDFSIQHQRGPANYVSTYNHSETLKKEEVSIPAGKATLLTIAHDNFTAVTQHMEDAKTDTIYWLYVTKPTLNDSTLVDTYILSGVVTGDMTRAKAEILEVAKTWNPPVN